MWESAEAMPSLPEVDEPRLWLARTRLSTACAAARPLSFPPMSIGELVAAAVVDTRVWDAYGDNAPDGVYLVGQPGPALPFVLFRAWKVPIGFVNEEIRLIGPSGRTIFRWGPEARRMVGAMDLTTEVDQVDGRRLRRDGDVRGVVHPRRRDRRRDRVPGLRAVRAGQARPRTPRTA